MTKRILMALSVMLLVMQSMTILAQDIQVMVLPFDVHSLEDLTYLKTEIPKLISNQLKSEGAGKGILWCFSLKARVCRTW